jgi:nucleoside-diphosphate-sugar epimerase
MTGDILLTGASGFFGGAILRKFKEKGHDPFVLALEKAKTERAVVGDLRDPRLALGEGPFREVYHIAGLAHRVPRSEEEKKAFFDTNLEGTRNLLGALEKLGRLPEAFVFISTVSVYGLEEGEELSEDTPLRPNTPYGESKARAEELVLEWGARLRVRIGIVRPPLIAGPNPPGNLGAMIRAIRNHRYLGMGDGQVRKSMVMADDVADALPAVARAGGVYHLTDGLHPAFCELEAGIAEILKMKRPPRLPLPVAAGLAKAGDLFGGLSGRRAPFDSNVYRKMTRPLTFSDQRARDMINWKPTSVLERLREVVP